MNTAMTDVKRIFVDTNIANILAHGITELFTHNVADFVRYQHPITVMEL
jgi:hypothetical protein